MNDVLLENSLARSLIRNLRLPLPVPERLERASGPWEERPLEGAALVVAAAPGGELGAALAAVIARAGGEIFVGDDAGLRAVVNEAGEAYGRTARALSSLGDRRPRALVFDATGIATVAGLESLYAFFHEHVGSLARSGRVLVVGRPPEGAETAEGAAARRALEGFVRSVAKEIGKRGATAQSLLVEIGAESRIEGPLRFLLSRRSAFVTAQPIRVDGRTRGAAPPAGRRPLDRKVALVTGAARGIGEATATRLAEEGAIVVCLDRPEDGEAAGALARRIGGEPLLLDVTAIEAPGTIADALRERHGGLDVVVHNAGVTRDRTLARMEPKQWSQALEVNLGAPARITRALVEGGVLRDGGRIVCLSSVAGIAGNVGQTNYAAAKAGLIGFVGKLALDLAERGVTVNAVAPGFIETRMTAAVPLFVREAGRRLAALGQGGLPADVAEAITFLASPGAIGITGSVLRVCGGAFLGA
jgi:3-oxoacyl-[acyl-carrier protein] reductase